METLFRGVRVRCATVGQRLASVVRFASARERRSWVAATLLLVAAGTTISVLAARSDALTGARDSRQAFRASAAAAATQLRLALAQEADLALAADAFIAGNPTATELQFKRWAATIQVRRRYRGIAGVGFVAVVPATRLSAFERTYTAALSNAHGTSPAVFPPGRRPYYCLAKLGVGGSVDFTFPPSIDACVFDRALPASLASGVSTVTSIELTGGSVFTIGTPVYSTGVVPASASARRATALGWTAIAVLPRVLLVSADRGHSGLALTLARGSGISAVSFMLGTAPADAHSIVEDLHDGWTLTVAQRLASASILANASALRSLLGGVLVSLLLASLVFVLGTGRRRALNMVAEKTRELELEVAHTAAARDAAVEASTARSTFVATVSHELRTPLAGVIGTADLLLDTRLDAEQEEYAHGLRSSGEALLLVINDILDYSKLEAGKLELHTEEFALRELIAECIARMRPAAQQKGIAMHFEPSPAVPDWIYGDSGRLAQVLMNLLTNAVKFTERGEVTVRTMATPDGPRSRVRFEVTDTGIGIDKHTLPQLFSAFTQADGSTARRYGGTGLGLAISAELVEMMGGQIGASSSPGAGSTFWFEVTLARGDGSGAVIKPAERFTARGERDADGHLTTAAPLVLVAEDNPVNRMLAVRMLDKCGYRSAVASGGVEALRALEQTSYAAILMDCQMPDMDGYQTTREIRRRENATGHIPIIAVTAHSLAGDREKCLAAGMDGYVSKPLRSSDLLEALGHLVTCSSQGADPASRTLAPPPAATPE